MKRFLTYIVVFAFVSILTVVVLDVIMLSCKNNYSLRSHEINYINSYNRLKSLKDSNKIVIISGSSGSFSINSKMIHKVFNMPVVNTSTHAKIGVRMQFETYKDYLRKGDVVVLCPEYGGDKSRLYGGTALLRIVSTHLPSAYSKLSFSQWAFLHKYIGIHFDEALKYDDEEIAPAYSNKALNEYGDIGIERYHGDSIKGCQIEGKVDSEYIEYLKYIRVFTRKNGIKLIFIPPTLMKSTFNSKKKQIDSIEYSLKCNGILFDALPERYSFPDSLYFDTPYHMTTSGTNKRTQLLIEDMLKKCGNNKGF